MMRRAASGSLWASSEGGHVGFIRDLVVVRRASSTMPIGSESAKIRRLGSTVFKERDDPVGVDGPMQLQFKFGAQSQMRRPKPNTSLKRTPKSGGA